MLSFVVVVGLAAAFTSQLVRALPGIRGCAKRGAKPWSCDLCMSLWSALAWVGATAWLRGELLVLDAFVFAASAAVSLLTLSWIATPPEAPPGQG
jgi:hypothetical protein